MLSKIRNLAIGKHIEWHNSPMCSTMIGECVNKDGMQFQISYITTNWEASQGYYLIRRVA